MSIRPSSHDPELRPLVARALRAPRLSGRSVRRIASTLLLLGGAPGLAGAQSGGTQGPPTNRGLVLAPGAGERLVYCERPLDLTLSVDSVTAPTTRLVAGIGELRGDEGSSRHGVADEIVYVISGWGRAAFDGDTVPLGPGSVAHVPPGTAHRIVSTGPTPMRYFFVLGPSSSAAAFRRAAARGCAAGAPASTTAAAPAPAARPTAPGVGQSAPAARATVLAPGEGPRISYCPFPLVITAKVDSTSAPSTRLTAAAGSLRRGAEVGTHRTSDEVVYITHGRGRAFIGADTTEVEAGSVTFVPAGTEHGFVNDGDDTLEYFVVYGSPFGRSGFRALAARPGPFCPAAR